MHYEDPIVEEEEEEEASAAEPDSDDFNTLHMIKPGTYFFCASCDTHRHDYEVPCGKIGCPHGAA